MVSFRGDELRVHEGYLSAPRDVHRGDRARSSKGARAPSDARRSARIVAHVVETPRGPSRRERTRPEDEPLAATLTRVARALQRRAFRRRRSKPVPVRVSRRMKSRLGHYSAAQPRREPARSRSAGDTSAGTAGTRPCTRCCTRWCISGRTKPGRPIDHGAGVSRQGARGGHRRGARRARASRLRSRRPTINPAVASTHARFLQYRQPALRGRTRRARQRPPLRRRARSADHRHSVTSTADSRARSFPSWPSSASSARISPRSTAARG